MTRRELRQRLRSPRVLISIGVVVILVLAVAVLAVVTRSPAVKVRSQFLAGTPEAGQPVQLDTSLFLPATTPGPAILLAHGFGDTKADVASEAKSLAGHGYVVLTYTARGFGRSGGLIHLDAPAYEVADASTLVSYLGTLPEVVKDAPGDPRVGVAGSSYGGALALLLAGYDKRVDAVGADITWNSLTNSLFPNATGDQPGVFKKLWAGELFGSGATIGTGACGRFAPDVCAAYEHAAQFGSPDAAMLALLRASSPASILDKITAPTLLSQGQQDSLFPLTEADANARGIAANGTKVKVIWRTGGHDGSTSQSELSSDLRAWFDPILKHQGRSDTSFELAVRGASISSETGEQISQTLRVDSYPGLGDAAPTNDPQFEIRGPAQTINAPAGGNPAAVTDLPGLGDALSTVQLLGGSSGLPGGVAGQTAAFESAPLDQRQLIAGASTITLSVTPLTTTDATLFVGLHDVAPDGTDTLPSSLVAPLKLAGLTPGVATTVTVKLPAVVQQVAAGHRLRLTVATTDLAYQLPIDPRSYRIALAGGTALAGTSTLSVPTVTGHVVRNGHPIVWLIVGLLAIVLVIAIGLLRALRRRLRVAPDRALVDVPVSIDGLVKEYRDGYRAVGGVTFRVERGQVVGLLGPNGAGKTTTLRVLMGLIHPTAGSVRVFGELVVPGARVLSRIGAFIEGPGFLPHLSGRENLHLYWAASGRPPSEADFETALEIAGLGASVDRRVKTYSHGMKQRLAIAQAMLGLPELLVLDEPTNGLDPPQIAEMREVLRRYAETGRTVIVSSHLLAEVEQTCTHVVVMHKGMLIAAGSVFEIAGAGGMQLAVDDVARAERVLAAAGISAEAVPARRALEDVFLDLVGGD